MAWVDRYEAPDGAPTVSSTAVVTPPGTGACASTAATRWLLTT